ncbi:DUF5682 family protein [Streptomyces meridianus]|uniref:DUF5682 family protein n=1 Tax=Streptomyces meridianus TaxID=2938945 RepID=A0ABT0XDG2_9ACTN|nr:DUF5682 family protein [Streptomyces meridianus]MCM2580567.1 DUF5682 family protein [Streptomyces meridianus]
MNARPAPETAAARQPRRAGGPQPLLLGVRHHGPGSARSVRIALDHHRPPAVLVEGPPEADGLLPLAVEEDMRPPVALLAHVAGDPARAAFWPFAEFSPEWVAIRWAVERKVPVRFIDLPAANSLALQDECGAEREERRCRHGDGEPGEAEQEGQQPSAALRLDPVGALAEAAGYDDPERWWEDAVEHRAGGPAEPGETFAAIGEAMAELRAVHGDGGHDHDPLREAHMRLKLRAALKEFGDGVAVVCGAWHVPALTAPTTATADRQLLKGLPKARAELTWVPWTHRRLARHSGYGAGIHSPGWYGHLYNAPDRPVERWMTKVAGLLRAEDHPVSSAHVIEAVRLAGTLAAMRGRPLAGLVEATDAVRAVMCEGSDVPLALVHERLVVGDALGDVPDSAPAVPLQRDLTRLQRSLRLKPAAEARDVELDLRKDTDAARSRLLHRLRLLRIGWGRQTRSRVGTGTFRETWRLGWEPELSVRVAEAGVWGTTVASAATAKAESDAMAARRLPDVTGLAEDCLLAGLPDALSLVMRVLADRAALDTDVGHLAEALPALVRSARYGDVRGSDAGALAEVATAVAERVFVGLPPAVVGLDADGAAGMRRHLDAVHTAVGLLDRSAAHPHSGPDGQGRSGGSGGTEGSGPAAREPVGPGTPARTGADGGGLRDRWARVLHTLVAGEQVPGPIRGRAARLLLDDERLDHDAAARLMGLVLSPGTPPDRAAAWIEGFVGGGAGGGMLLVHDTRLLALLDAWLTAVPADAFTDVLPLLRRTFSAYEAGVRRTLGELVRRGPTAGGRAHTAATAAGAPGYGPGLDAERASAVRPTVHRLLGLGTDLDKDDHRMAGAVG